MYNGVDSSLQGTSRCVKDISLFSTLLLGGEIGVILTMFMNKPPPNSESDDVKIIKR